MKTEMPEPLTLRRQRRFEIWFLGPFGIYAIFRCVVDGIERDWWSVVIWGIACLVTGGIGAQLPKNRHKSFSQLRAGPGVHEEVYSADEFDNFQLTRAIMFFSFVSACTFAAVGIHFGREWWVVLLAGIGTWLVFNFAALFSVALVREQCPTTRAILSGDFDDSQIGQMLAKWFKSRPQREEQRQLFVNILLAVGCPPARLAERTLRCVTGAMGGEENLGELLAREAETIIVFDPPQTAEQEAQQRRGKEALAGIADRLRLLDSDALRKRIQPQFQAPKNTEPNQRNCEGV
jgi:hypothetical protein